MRKRPGRSSAAGAGGRVERGCAGAGSGACTGAGASGTGSGADGRAGWDAASAAGVRINYDPALREAFIAGFNGPPVDLWPLWEATAGLPVALIRGANSDLLTAETVAGMKARRPDMIHAEVPDRAHIPFLDEPEALAALRAFLAAVEGAAP